MVHHMAVSWASLAMFVRWRHASKLVLEPNSNQQSPAQAQVVSLSLVITALFHMMGP